MPIKTLLSEAPCIKASLPRDEAKALTAVEQALEGINTVGPSEARVFPRTPGGLLVRLCSTEAVFVKKILSRQWAGVKVAALRSGN